MNRGNFEDITQAPLDQCPILPLTTHGDYGGDYHLQRPNYSTIPETSLQGQGLFGESVALPGVFPQHSLPERNALDQNERHLFSINDMSIGLEQQPITRTATMSEDINIDQFAPVSYTRENDQIAATANACIIDQVGTIYQTGGYAETNPLEQTGSLFQSGEDVQTGNMSQAGNIAQALTATDANTIAQIRAIANTLLAQQSGHIDQAVEPACTNPLALTGAVFQTTREPFVEMEDSLANCKPMKDQEQPNDGASMAQEILSPNSNVLIEYSGTQNSEPPSSEQEEDEMMPDTEDFNQPSNFVNVAQADPLVEGPDDTDDDTDENLDDRSDPISVANIENASSPDDAMDSKDYPAPLMVTYEGNLNIEKNVQVSRATPAAQENAAVDASCGPSTALIRKSGPEPGPSNQREVEHVVIDARQLQGFGYKCILVTNPLLCTFCAKPFADEKSRMMHVMRSHSKDISGGVEESKGVECVFCTKKLKNEINHRRHVMNVHSGETATTCEVCGAKFRTRHAGATHRRQVHGILAPSARKRPKRGKLGKRRKVFRVLEVKKTLKVFRCDCGTYAGTKGNIERHISIVHVKVRPYECKCGRTFKTKNHMQCHMTSKSCERVLAARERAQGRQEAVGGD